MTFQKTNDIIGLCIIRMRLRYLSYQGGSCMKRLLCIILAAFAAATVFTSCAAKKTNVNVKIVIDQGYDGSYDETLFEESIEVQGKNPSVESVITALDNSQKVAIEYEQDEDGNSVIKSISGKENKEEDKEGKSIYYEWVAKVNDEDVRGKWKDFTIKDGDTVIFIYAIWEPSQS